MNGTLFKKTRNKIAAITLVLLLGISAAAVGSAAKASNEASTQLAATGGYYMENPVLLAAEGKVDSPIKSVTRSGVTLSISQVLFDGNRLDIYLQQAAGKMGKGIFIDVGQFPTVSVDGSRLSYQANVTSVPGDGRTAVLSFSRARQPQLPDEFNMKLEVYAKNVKEPFAFNLPVKKLKSLVALQPDTTHASGGFSYTADYFEMTPLMMELKLRSTGKIPAVTNAKGRPSKMLYDIADDKGTVIGATVSSTDIQKMPGTNSTEDLWYAATFKAVPKTITIKPYTYSMDTKGSILKDSKGNWVKSYYKDLEMKITVTK